MQGLEGGTVRPEEGELAPFKQFVFDQRWLVRQLVEDTRFNQAFLGITILNTLFLALAYDGRTAVDLHLLWLHKAAQAGSGMSLMGDAVVLCLQCEAKA